MRLSWGCDKAKIFSDRTLGNPCARGYTHAHNTLILVYISVRVAKSRARILYTNTHTGPMYLIYVAILGDFKISNFFVNN